MKPVINFDRDGYPTDKSLRTIIKWTCHWEGTDIHVAQRPLLEAVVEAWEYPESAQEVRPGVFTFATGGWSGNEDLMAALENNALIRACWDKLYLPGGLYVFCIGPEGKSEYETIADTIREWAWKGRKEAQP